MLYRPILVLSKLWPYIALLLSFSAFVLWNGGVVLGDKANHVATIHLPQLLYLWPFIAFFSFPIILPSALSLLVSLSSPVVSLFSNSSNAPQVSTSSSRTQGNRRFILTQAHISNAFLVVFVVIKYNTLIHPFTLADNRHYVFYVFRYTILRHPLIRYLLAPAYILSFYLSYLTLSNPIALAKPQFIPGTARSAAQDNPKTSFMLIFILSTGLSLITAPLVEPRYFIIPWVIWRLHVPTSYSSRLSQRKPRRSKNRESMFRSLAGAVKSLAVEGSALWLWGETFWFLLINIITGYIFLYRGFEWPQEPGKVQRFMW
ncbi:glycosyltransferase family 59 protein [Oidiodendron maius Zn]|uniref:Dol-P-Glc:Glc(2)Man(9)GlcNAc(2)-PP-Dol alpha-1,2-glucosyltransferase n=1 Tax=Oidiodendron maius (strain Zn) TaxID=913774 RepID=A0A0C3DA29_OIDMZ|nr:glycosyltransferase family 59 protein [Oidiodendron maius Zn]